MSTSSSSTSVIDWPAMARGRSPSAVTMRLTVLVRPDGCTRMAVPGVMLPPAIVPAKPRKSRLGRLTHCTGSRNGQVCASVDLHRFEIFHQRRAVIPGHAHRSCP
jgi:hypothetical protein